MRERPDSLDLVAAVSRVLRRRILPGLDPAVKLDLLMALNALAIAERQVRAGDGPWQTERASLSALLGTPVDDPVAGNRALSLRLRRGDGDPGSPDRAALLAHLQAVARDRLAESNPRVLAGARPA